MSESKKQVDRPGEDTAQAPERLLYVTPTLRLLGDAVEITRGATGSHDDGTGTRTYP